MRIKNSYAEELEETNLIQFHVCPVVSLAPFLISGLGTGFFLPLGMSYCVSFHFLKEPSCDRKHFFRSLVILIFPANFHCLFHVSKMLSEFGPQLICGCVLLYVGCVRGLCRKVQVFLFYHPKHLYSLVTSNLLHALSCCSQAGRGATVTLMLTTGVKAVADKLCSLTFQYHLIS